MNQHPLTSSSMSPEDRELYEALSPLEEFQVEGAASMSPEVAALVESRQRPEAIATVEASPEDSEAEEASEDELDGIDIISAAVSAALSSESFSTGDLSDILMTADVEDPRLLVACMVLSDTRPFSARRFVELVQRVFPDEVALARQMVAVGATEEASELVEVEPEPSGSEDAGEEREGEQP